MNDRLAAVAVTGVAAAQDGADPRGQLVGAERLRDVVVGSGVKRADLLALVAELADAEYRRLYRGYDEAADWDPGDPRLDELADAMVRYIEQRSPGATVKWDVDDPTAVALLTSRFDVRSPPALQRLTELTEEKARRLRLRDVSSPPAR